MSEPIVTCPNCRHEIKLTESLAAPLIEATRKQYDQLIARKDAEVAEREAAIKSHAEALAKQKAEIDERIATTLKTERGKIAAEEAAKAKLLVGTEIEQKARELADLQAVLKERDAKLADAQKAQAEVMRQEARPGRCQARDGHHHREAGRGVSRCRAREGEARGRGGSS